MAGETIWYFIKFFEREEHADQFIKGSLYLNRLSYFKKAESALDDGRPDSNEAVAMWWQPHDIVIDLNVPGIGATRITSEDLAAPVSTQFEFHDHIHVFCLYAVYTKGFQFIDGKIDLASNQVGELEEQLRIDQRCFQFGRHAVIVSAVQFMDRLKFALGLQSVAYKWKLVEYYDEETFHGEIPRKEIPFRKQKRFSYQKEFRICVQTNTRGTDPRIINIGDLSKFSAKLDSRTLNEKLKLKLEPA